MKPDETRTRHKFVIYLGMAVLALLILFSSTASAIVINGTQITSRLECCNPDIYGNKIVWQEMHTIGLGDCNFIYMYDIPTSQRTQITRDIEPYEIDPAIYEDKIVWIDAYNGYNVYMYDISTFQETLISHSGQASSPDIYGDKIVWVNSVSQFGYVGDICVYNLSINNETCITNSRSACAPAIYGNRIVWEDGRNGKSDIYMFDLSTSLETQISTSGSAHAPSIYGDRIVWEDERIGSKICMFDLSTSLETPISNSGSDPSIYGDRILWEDINYYSMMGNGGFGMYNTSTHQKISVHTSNPVVNPAIYGDRIVWQDGLDSYGNIWFYTISEENMEPILPVANFSTNISSGIVPLSVKFTDLSENVSAWFSEWNWDFGDGITSTVQNPIHTYSEAGTYIVNLTISNEEGTDSELVTITVLEKPILPVANFSTNVTEGFAPLSVQFTNSSEYTTGLNWDFTNDGSIDSIEENPVYVYINPGTYTVNLTAINTNGTDSKTATITVIEQPVPPIADFSASPTIGTAPLTVTFVDKSTGSPTSWSWNFGDKSTSIYQKSKHTYSKAGKYTVSLTVKNELGSNTRKITNYIIVKK